MNDEQLVQLLDEAQHAQKGSDERQRKIDSLWQELQEHPGIMHLPGRNNPNGQHMHCISDCLRSRIGIEIDQFKPMSDLRMNLADWIKERLYQAYDDQKIFRKLLDLLAQPPKENEERTEWNQAMSQLLSYLLPLLNQYHRYPRPVYQDGLNKTIDWLIRKLRKEGSGFFQPKLPSVTQSLMCWVNSHLSWNIRKVIEEEKTAWQNSSATEHDNDQDTRIEQIPLLEGIDKLIQREQNKKIKRIGQSVEQYVREDPDGKLRACYPGSPPNSRYPDKYPECNCQFLAIRRLLTHPPEEFRAIAEELDILRTKVESHWFDRCIPLLRKIAKGFGYEPSNTSNRRSSPRKGLQHFMPQSSVPHSIFTILQDQMKFDPIPTTIFLPKETHQDAMQFAIEQSTPIKGKQVYLNTLAVHAVRSWLESLQVKTSLLPDSDCWDPGLRAMFDIADLYVPGIGRLECRPVLPGESWFATPTEITPDLIGCIAVQFSNDLAQVELLGFVPAIVLQNNLEEVALQSVQPLSVLINQFYSSSVPTHTVLSQWLQTALTVGWQSLDSLKQEAQINWSPARFAMKDRSQMESRVRAKRIELEKKSVRLEDFEESSTAESYTLAFVVGVTPQNDEEIEVLLQVHALHEQCLPANVHLVVLDESDTNIAQAVSKEHDALIQQKIRGKPGEKFSVELKLESERLLEKFVI